MTDTRSDSPDSVTPETEPHLRVALVRAQGVAVSTADARRITRVADAIAAALAKAAGGSLFDTEPAHFDRDLIARGRAGASSPSAAS